VHAAGTTGGVCVGHALILPSASFQTHSGSA
jgi:hypothetical protein